MKISILTTSIAFPSEFPHLTYDYFSTVFNLMKNIDETLRIATYVINEPILDFVEKYVLKKNKQVRLILNSEIQERTLHRINDLESKYPGKFLVKIWEKNQRFHSKLLIFDKKHIVIGSHNFTYEAVVNNIEISILLENADKQIMNKFLTIYDYLFNKI